MYLRRVGHLQSFIRSSSIVALLLLILLVQSTFGELIQGNRSVEIGGATYQNFSYIAATSFAIFVINANIRVSAPCGRRRSHGGLLRVVGLSIASLVAVALVVLGGGRGAMITVITFALFFFGRAFSSLRLRNLGYALCALLSVGAAIAFLVSKLSPGWIEVFEFGFRRAFSYIFAGDEYLEDGTGGRIEIYRHAVALLSDSPLFGYGVFGVHGTLIHPHNIALEWGLQFGLPVAAVLIVWMMWCFVAAIRSNDIVRRWCCQFLAIGLIMLSFSGSYLETGVFWFGIVALYDKSCNRHPIRRLRAVPSMMSV
jgi:O-antigen ligase